MAERFYINWPLACGSQVVLRGAEAHHLAVVCRHRPGDQVFLFNGNGREYRARVCACERQQVLLEVLSEETPARELPFALEVAAPLPRGERMHFLVEKLTELGATRLVPLVTARSRITPGVGRLEKLRRYVIEACKQCGRNRLLEITPPQEWLSYCRSAAGRKILAHPGAEPASAWSHLRLQPAQSALAVAVGPEGGFTPQEVAAGQQAGWQLLDLGPRLLRIETAALVLTAWALAANTLTTS
jgi:16S rRNA (uracil1498-N3)-methyltransferase